MNALTLFMIVGPIAILRRTRSQLKDQLDEARRVVGRGDRTLPPALARRPERDCFAIRALPNRLHRRRARSPDRSARRRSERNPRDGAPGLALGAQFNGIRRVDAIRTSYTCMIDHAATEDSWPGLEFHQDFRSSFRKKCGKVWISMWARSSRS